MNNFQKRTMEYCTMFEDSVVILGGEKDKEILGFTCPICNEPLYFEDWNNNQTRNWSICPICGSYLVDEDNE